MCCNFARYFAIPLLLVLSCCAVVPAQGIFISDQNGAAASAINEDLDLWGTNFVDYTTTGYGGAVYFEVDGRNAQTLRLGAGNSESREMTRNYHLFNTATNTGTSNSITFAGPSGTSDNYGIARFEMNVDGTNNYFNMNDPMYVVPGSNLLLDIDKTGNGVWNLYGHSNLSGAGLGAKINVAAGTLVLGNASALTLTSTSRNDALLVRTGAELRIGNTGIDGAGVEIRTSCFQIADQAGLYLAKDLTLTLYSQSAARSAIDGTLSGPGGLFLKGDGTLEFTGATDNYSGDLNLGGGSLVVNSTNTFETTGHVELGKDTELSVFVNPNAATIKVDSITINGTHLNITGVYGSTGTYVILESNHEIQGGFFEDASESAGVTYLTADFGFSDAGNPSSADYRRRYEGTITLRWNASIEDGAVADPENGLFDIDPSTGGADYFVVGTVLKDNTSNGKTLIKRGWGTLELATANEYYGNTLIENGTVKLTDSLGAGTVGNVVLSAAGTLELDFDKASFSLQVTGDGRVRKSGTGTVRLTNVKNDYTGGTVLEAGTLAVEDVGVLGTGALTFEGGKLLLEDNGTGYVLTQDVAASLWNDAWFESINDLEITSTIRGDGSLRKTGTGTLILSGQGTYTGDTKIEEGTLVLTNGYALGKGNLVLSDGVRFKSTADFVNNRDIVLKYEGSRDPEDGVIFDIQSDLVQEGDVSGRGKLVKIGEKTLTLAGENTFTGGLVLQEGTVAFSSQQNLGDGAILFDGGVLRNTAAIENLNAALTMRDDEMIRLETAEDMTVSSVIKGDGGLHKTGEGTLTLTGANRYRGETRIYEGTLINDGSMDSKVYVENGAAFGGNGYVYNNVYFQSGSAYQWNFGLSELDSDCLTVGGDVYLDNAVFRPMTAGAMEAYPDVIENWAVLRYTGELKGDKMFAGIDNEFSPFYDFYLDYSQTRVVTVTGYHRRDPRPLSDSVAMGIDMAQRRVHRRAYEQVDKELQGGRDMGLRGLNSHSAGFSSHIWGDFYGRTTEYESSYHSDDYRLTSFGLQAGYSFLSSNWLSFGITGGVEFPVLRNRLDRIKMTDGFVGLYYGQRIYNMWEIKGYLGGGTQRYKSRRSDTRYRYSTKYHGDSFEGSIELGRPFLLGHCMVRPHVGFDFGYAGQQAAKENQPSAEYRTYSEASLTQVFVRVGIDLQRTYQRADGFFGISYSNLIGGQSLPSVKVYYPVSKSGTTVYGTKLGQNMFTFRTGGNLYLDEAKSRSFFMNLTADMYTDRQNTKAEFSGSFGYDYRF